MILHKVVTVGTEREVQQLARQVGQEIFAADNLPEAVDIIETIDTDLILFDHHFSPAHIREFLDTTDKNSDAHIVVVGRDENNPDVSEEFIQMGAYDYLCGKQDHPRLKQIVNQIKDKLKGDAAKKNADGFFANGHAASVSIVGWSKAILDNLKMIKLVAESGCNPILIVGETGTGKELAAKAIHIIRHPNEPFVAVNCAALTANLLESELFGHVKGSFTGADREKTGLLELAGAGTIFLDEISEMPVELQAKLLRVLQEKTFRKVGGTGNITCHASIMTSSNCNLKSEIEAGRFRRDLYYRLNICPVTIAPLRAPQRRKDISLLTRYFIETSTICPEKKNKINSITKLALEALQEHDWPGNVRELQNVIERAILLETTDKIGLSSIVIDPTELYGISHTTATDKIKDFSLAKAERELIARALQETGWQKTKAATLLNITRATLYAKIKQYNIEKGCYIAKETPDEISTPSLPEPVTVA